MNIIVIKVDKSKGSGRARRIPAMNAIVLCKGADGFFFGQSLVILSTLNPSGELFMKRKFTMMVAVAALALTAGSSGAVSIGDYPAGTAANGIAGSRHNMGGLGHVIRASETTEICVFCHTPHGSDSARSSGSAR